MAKWSNELRPEICPGSGGKKKCWPLEEWLRELDGFDYPLPWGVTWLAGEVEEDLSLRLTEKWRRGPHGIMQNRPLLEVFQVVQSAEYLMQWRNQDGVSVT